MWCTGGGVKQSTRRGGLANLKTSRKGLGEAHNLRSFLKKKRFCSYEEVRIGKEIATSWVDLRIGRG